MATDDAEGADGKKKFLGFSLPVPLKEKVIHFREDFLLPQKCARIHEKEGMLGFAIFVNFCAFLWPLIRLRLCHSGVSMVQFGCGFAALGLRGGQRSVAGFSGSHCNEWLIIEDNESGLSGS